MRIHFDELYDLVTFSDTPVLNLASGAANNNEWVSLEQSSCLDIFVLKTAGTAGQDPVLTLLQGKTSAGGSSKALEFTRLAKKEGGAAGGTNTLADMETFTVVDPIPSANRSASATNTYTDTTSAEKNLVWVVTIFADDLDVDNGFVWVNANIADTGTNDQDVALFGIRRNLRYLPPKTGIA